VLSEGDSAPQFELPALVDGERRRVALDEYLGDDVVILAFYPADFNPACDEESCDLDELDLFTMQKDVTILGISPDSVYSHRAFAEQYDLKVPLLADTDGTVAAQYDIGIVDDIGQHLLERAVAVIDHDGDIHYSWSTAEMSSLPRVEEIKDAIAETGGDDTAFARYRVGHAHYTEGRRAFTSAMNEFQQSEWMMAQNDFKQAREEFEEAADQFDTAVRFVDDETREGVYDDANEKATALWQAADWLTQAASAYSSGAGSEGQELRDDAERPLETVREYMEPPDPDEEWPPEMESLEKDQPDDHSILPTNADEEAVELAVDIDEEMGDTADEATVEAESPTATADTSDGGEETDDPPTATVTADDETVIDDDIDDAELAEIQAELEANNTKAEEMAEESTAIVEGPPMAADDADRDGEAASEATDSAQTAEATEDTSAESGAKTPSPEADVEIDEQSVDEETGEQSTDEETNAETDEQSTEEKAREELARLQAELDADIPSSEPLADDADSTADTEDSTTDGGAVSPESDEETASDAGQVDAAEAKPESAGAESAGDTETVAEETLELSDPDTDGDE